MSLAKKKAVQDIRNIEHHDDAEALQALLIGKTTGGTYTSLLLNDDGSIKTSGGGTTTFLGLTDTPSSYSGEANKFVAVKSTEDGLEFKTSSASVAHTDLTDMPDTAGTNSDHDARYLKLDQSTPQTVSNGIPLLDTTPNGNADIKSFVNKEYVDLAVTSLGAVYYMHDEDDATGYKTCYLEPSSDAETYLEKADLSDDDYIAGWISATGEAPSKLLKGVYDWFITLEKTSGTKDLRVYWELIERKSDNSEVVIATSSNSNLITDKESYLVPLQLDNDYIPDTNSRIVGKLYADVSGSGNAPTVKLYYQGDTSSRWEIPANSEVFKNIFVPYSDAVKNVDLGDKNLTTTGNINGGNLNITNWDTAYSWGDHSTAGYFVKATDTTDDITEGTTNKFYSDEKVDDRVANLIQDGTGISWTYDDTSNTLTGNVSLASFDTDNLSEGSSNLYWTQTRFNSAFSNKTTDDLSEGSTNFYYTDAKFDTRFATKTTDNLSEGSSNLYYTDARVGNYGDSNYLKLDGSNANSDIDISPYNITAGNLNISDWNTAYSWGDHSIEGYLKDITNESIGDLSDVDLTDIADGKILKYNSTSGNWECETESGATQLSDLSDVNTSTPTAGNVLRANGVDWESTTLSHSDLSGVGSDDHHTRYALTEDLSSNEISQLQNIDSVTISNTQWGYLGAMTGQPLEDLSGQTTDDLAEGTTNKYYSDELVDDRVANLIQDGTGISWTYNDNTNTLTANVSLASFDTDDLSEGSSNKYYSDALVDAHLSGGVGISYSSGTISLSHLGFENLTDPNADRILFWDDSKGALDWKDFSNWDTAYSWGNHADAGYFVKGSDSIDEANDVDTTTDTPQKNEVLKWNGSKWVPAPYNYNFTFSIASFSDGESTIQLIGSGVWRSSGAMSYSASYNNGPPTSATVKMSINGGSYNTVGSMNSPDYESGTNSQNINYPTSKDQYLRFRLDASDGTDNDTQYESSIYFRNYLYWGVSSKNSGFTESDIEALSGKQLTNDHTQSKTISAGSGKYLVWACPANYTDLPTGTDYETNGGGTGFVFKGMTCAFQTKETVSVTNSAGYTENYEVYASTLPNLGYGTLTTYTSRQAINKIYYGTTTKTSGYTESDVENLEKSEITNDSTQIWDSLTAGSGEYLLFAFPKRWGIKGTDYSFYDYSTGFEASFLNPETVSITNSNGWTEDFYVYRSENANLGTITIQTK